MEEKRKFKRVKANLKLNISSVYKQNNVLVENIDAPITITDISKSGIGFISSGVFPEGYYFNADLKIGSNDEVIHCVVKIVRVSKTETSDVYSYGCEYVGMPEILMYLFDEYEEQIEHNI